MRVQLVDRIVAIENGKSLQATKNLTLGEEYLADHFPTFPVMPGVLMLQALVEAGAWLLRVTEDFKHSVIVLREAKNVKYGHFMDPGRQMQIRVEMIEHGERLATFKGKGEVEGQASVTAGRITVERYNLRDHNPALQASDERIIAHLRGVYLVLQGGFAPVP